MSTSPQDTEITLGTGRMLALFFALVVVCALFFAVGFSLGRKAVNLGASNRSDQTQTPASVVRPSAGKNTPPSGSPSDTFSFYKAVEQKTADSQLASPPAAASAPAKADAQAQPADAAKPANADAGAPPTNPYFVQVAAVTRQEDADSLVDALKKKQYPAFSTSPTSDKYYRVQIGPFADTKDAEQTRAKLVADGYNPIVKK